MLKSSQIKIKINNKGNLHNKKYKTCQMIKIWKQLNKKVDYFIIGIDDIDQFIHNPVFLLIKGVAYLFDRNIKSS